MCKQENFLPYFLFLLPFHTHIYREQHILYENVCAKRWDKGMKRNQEEGMSLSIVYLCDIKLDERPLKNVELAAKIEEVNLWGYWERETI